MAVPGYGVSTLVKPFFYFANSWGIGAGVRWADRVGKGIRTAPRDALVADSIPGKPAGASPLDSIGPLIQLGQPSGY